MNYIILNSNEIFNNINIKNFKEVNINGNERVDGIFGEFTPGILETLNNEPNRRDSIFQEQWLLRDRGVMFMVFKIPEGILHDKYGEVISKIIELYDEKNFYIEVWSYCCKNKWEYFLICLNKNLGFYTMNDQQIFVENNSDGLNQIYKKIEEIIEI